MSCPFLDEERRLRGRCLAPELVERVLRYGAPVGARIERHVRLARCMDRARALIREQEDAGRSVASGALIVADSLSAGRGRFQRDWYAPTGNLHLAMIWADTLLPEFSRLLPLIAGTACCETLCAYSGAVRLKWVNDLLVQGRKVAGILTETVASGRRDERYLLVGLGINCNTMDFPGELADSAVSLRQLRGAPVAVDELLARLLVKLRWNLGLLHYQEELALEAGEDPWLREGLKPLVMDAWRGLSDSLGRRVLYGFDVQQRPLYEARVLAVEDDGGIRLGLADGSETVEYSGELRYLDD